MNNFIKVDNYIIRKRDILVVKTKDNKGEYYIYIHTDKYTISIFYKNYTERDKEFKRIFKELNEKEKEK